MSTQTIRTWREQGLSATVHLACTRCHAPGVYTSAERIRMFWPGCYLSPTDCRAGEPVGDRCPNCGAARGPSSMKSLGEIWRRLFN